MSQSSKARWISRKEHKEQEKVEASQKRTLRMYTHIKFFKDYKRDNVINKSKGDMGRTNCSTAASTMNPRHAATGPPTASRNTRNMGMAMTHY